MFGVDIKFGILIVARARVVVLGLEGSGLVENLGPGPQGERWRLDAFFFVIVISCGRRNSDLFFVNIAAKLNFLYKKTKVHLDSSLRNILLCAYHFLQREA